MVSGTSPGSDSFPTTAYVEVWGDHGFDIECNTPLDDVRTAMTDDNRGKLDLPDEHVEVLRMAAAVFASAPWELR